MKFNLFFFFLLTALTISCSIDKTPLTEEQEIYAGKWMANDGSWIQIYNDGTGSLESGGTSVSGGQATITDNEIQIGLFGIKKTFTINEQPIEEDGVTKMKLNGYWYQKINLLE